MSGVAGLRGSGDWGTDERPKNFREMILFRNPAGSAPIFALMARVQKESTDDPEFAWWDEPNDIVRLQVAGALSSTDTEVVVDSSDPSASSPGLVWGTATHLKPGDLLLAEPATDAATFNQEIMEVLGVASDTSFTVRRGAAGTTAALRARITANTKSQILDSNKYDPDGKAQKETYGACKNINKFNLVSAHDAAQQKPDTAE